MEQYWMTDGDGPCWTYFSVQADGMIDEFGIIDVMHPYDWVYCIYPCEGLDVLAIVDNDQLEDYDLPKNWFLA
jgi:hypothetical protein